jgi:uncharacterized protein (DUF433 family)
MRVTKMIGADPVNRRPPRPRKRAAKPPITRHPERLGGTPTIAGTRLPVTTLIDYLSTGSTVKEFLDDFEDAVSEQQVQAVLARIKEALGEGWLAEDVDD